MGTTPVTDPQHITVTVERFTTPDPGLQGTSVEAVAHSGDYFPTVFVLDNGEVEIAEVGCTAPADAAVEWLTAVANHIEAREDAR